MTNILQRDPRSVTAPTVSRLTWVSFWCATMVGMGVLCAEAQALKGPGTNRGRTPATNAPAPSANLTFHAAGGPPVANAGIFGFTSAAYFATDLETDSATPTAKLGTRAPLGAVITVQRTGGTDGRVVVNYTTVDPPDPDALTAESEDYEAVSGELVFDHLQSSSRFIVPVSNNESNDLDKTLLLRLTSVQADVEEENANPGLIQPVLGLDEAILNILEASGGPNMGTNFSIERFRYMVDEAPAERPTELTSTVVIDVIHPSGSGGNVELEVMQFNGWVDAFQPLSAGSDYAVSDTSRDYPGTISSDDFGQIRRVTNSLDYISQTVTLDFAAGQTRQTVTITVTNDTEVEFNEDIRVRLNALNNEPPLGANTNANVTILFEDQPAGALDREWNPDFVRTTNPRFNSSPGANGIIRALAVQADDKTLIAGDFTAYNSFSRITIARVNLDGSNDDTFNPGSGSDGYIVDMALYPATGSANSGKIIVGGGFTSFNNIQRNGIARLNPDGSLDGSFNPGAGADGVVRSVAIQSDGKVIIAGDFTTVGNVARRGVARLNSNGSLDGTFNSGSGADGPVWSVAVEETGDRKIIIGGEFLDFNGVYRGNIARLNDNGSLDATFDPGGGADGAVYTVAAQADGGVLIGGFFGQVSFKNCNNIARLLPDGSIDLTFNAGSGANDAVYDISLDSNGKIMVGGVFTVFNGTRRLGLTRLFNDGTVDTGFMDTAYNQFAGMVNSYYFEPPNYVNALAVQSDGAVMVGGSFQAVGGNWAAEIRDNDINIYKPFELAWTRQQKRPRLNLARLIGGRTPGPGNIELVFEENPVDERAGQLVAALGRRDGQLGRASVEAFTVDNLAVGGQDFDTTQESVAWLAPYYVTSPRSIGDNRENFFVVPIIDDNIIEGDETFSLNLTNPVGFVVLGGEVIQLGTALGRSEATATIVDNDFNRGTFAFSSPVYFTNENAGSLRLTVVRTNGSTGPVSVRYFTRNGTAIAGQDYSSVSLGTLTFGQGVTSQTLSIPLTDDFIVEPDETFTVTLTNATGGAVIFGGFPTSSITATVTIIDNDLVSGRPNFAATNFNIIESVGLAEIILERRGGSVGQLTVNVEATAGSATTDVDFEAVTNTITWVHGDVASKSFFVTLLDDLSVEGNETVNLRIFEPFPANAVGGLTNATLTIVEDDALGTLSFSQAIYDADERGTNITIFVIRSGGVGGTVTADYSITAGTASSPADYLDDSGTLTFGPGAIAASFEITINDNGLTDGERQATLNLGNFGPPSAAGVLISATLRIMDDESIGDPAGSLDTSFSALAGGTNAIHALAVQPDGKLLVGGEFRTLNRTLRNRVGRLNADGTLDPSFNALGGPNGTVRALALQPNDGRIVIGGFFDKVHATNRNHIARLLVDGSVDNLFNPGAGADNPVYALAIHPDGRIVAGGSFATVNGISRAGIALLEADGTVSTRFNPGTGADGVVFAVAVQNDGKILIGGDFTTINGISVPRLARLNIDGSLDTTFDAGTGPNGAVRAIAFQADGRILIGGSFTSVNGTDRGRLARLGADGALDTTFLAAVVGADADVSGIQLQFDGNIIVVGDFTRFNGVTRNHITRLHRNGKTDPTINFGEGANDSINAAVIQTDRKIVIGGRFTRYDGSPRSFLARIHGGSIAGPGSIEFETPSFSAAENDGEATIVVRRKGGTTEDVTADYLTMDGTATAGSDYTAATGTLTFLEGETRRTFTVPLLNDFVGEPSETVGLILTNQTPGVTLGSVPTATLTIENDDSGMGFSAAAYTVNENVIGGAVVISVTRTGATNETSSVNYSTANGTAIAGSDYSSRSGVLVFVPGQNLQTFTVPITDDALIESPETFTVNLSNLTGSDVLNIASATVTIVDNDFSSGVLAFSALTYSAVESLGSVTLSVVRTNGSTGVLAVDYTTAPGTASAGGDYTSQSGTLTFAEGQTSRTIVIAILDDSVVEGDETFEVQLYNPVGGAVIAGATNATVIILDEEFGPGSLDRTFATGAGANGLVRLVSVQSDGKVLLGGAFTAFDNVDRQYIARLEESGAHDLSFDPGAGADAFVASVAGTPGNRVMLAGAFSSVDGINFLRVARLDTNGATDLTFNRNAGLNAAVNVMTIQPNGRVLLGGAFSLPSRGVTRLQANGSVDNTFSPGLGADGAVHAILVQSDGSIVLGGAFANINGEPHSRVGRLSEAGLLDTAFATGVITNGSVFSLAQQADGKLLVGGDFITSGGTNRVNLARLNVDGTLDTSFDVGTGANAIVYAIGLQSDGKVIVGGDFTSINGTNRNRFARLNSDGSLDDTFDPGRGANNTVYSLAVLPDDNIIIGGDFTEVGGVLRRGVARILGGAVAPAGGISEISSAGGQVQLKLSLVPGRICVLESSPDLRQWTPVATNAATSSTWLFTDTSAGQWNARFFRVRQLAP